MPLMRRARAWDVPTKVREAWRAVHGDEVVAAWLEEARALADWCAEAWRLSVDGYLPGGALSCVLACRRADDSRAVLKLLPPWAYHAIASEAVALRAWRGHGVVDLLESTPDGRALLMRRISPGQPFAPSGDDLDDAQRIAHVLAGLAAAPTPSEVPDVSVAMRSRFSRARAAARHRRELVDEAMVDQAESAALELAGTWSDRAAVHGDAQNKNLLLDAGGDARLVAIDPEAGIGDRHVDAALWALTHRPGRGVGERCDMLTTLLDLDRDRMWSWCRVLVVAEQALDRPERARAHRDLFGRAL